MGLRLLDKQNIIKPKNFSKRQEIESVIDDIVDSNFSSHEGLKKLLKETAAHESHFGELSANIMRVDDNEIETLKQQQYQPQLAYLGARRNSDGSFKKDDLKTNIILGAMRYLRTLKDEIPSDQNKRYDVWKKYYNTDAGKGTKDSFYTSLDKFGMRERPGIKGK